jgi:hypothetical protein
LTLRGIAALFCGLGGCVGILDLDGYEDAVVELCKCNNASQIPAALQGSCVEVLSSRLDSATESTRQRWLEYYAGNCAGSCENAYACYSQEGTCSKLSCTDGDECCGGASCDTDTQLCVTP